MHVRIRMNTFVLRATRTTLATVFMGASVVACCSGIEDPDTQLQIELSGEVDADAEVEQAEQARLCGAEVIAVNGDERITMDEVELGEGGCVYRAEGVDPEVVYDIEASHPELGNGQDATTSNPSCSVRTERDTTDLAFSLQAPGDAQMAEGPPLDEGEQMNAEL